MSKKSPVLTWQDKAILIVIPLVVFAIFIFANYLSKDLTINDVFTQKLDKAMVRDSGTITELFSSAGIASPTQKCRVRSRDGETDFTFVYHIQGSDTMNLQVGRLIQFYGEYRYDNQGGMINVPFKGKSGRHTGWAVYENKRYFALGEENDNL